LKEGVGMVKAIKTSLKQLQLGSKLRHEVWQREIERFVHVLSTLHSDVKTRIFSLFQSARSRHSFDIDCCVRRSEGFIPITSALSYEQASQQPEQENLLFLMPFWMVSDRQTMNKGERLILFGTDNIVPTSGMRGNLGRLGYNLTTDDFNSLHCRCH